jgi:3-hydroxy-9,10-secoandrosta-1,3,5(10)-triene-9,17-dione monooxygenase reductase component
MTDLSQDFKDALSSWASGVSVVAAEVDDLLYGITVTSFTSVSLDPPLVLVCLKDANQLPGMIDQAGGFTVSFLAADQAPVSNDFASPGREPTLRLHADIPGVWTRAGRPIVRGAVAWLCCDVHQRVEAGDHVIYIGAVVEAVSDPDQEPLLYCRRTYRRFDCTAINLENEDG